jgi:hypothetical protein
MRKLVLREICSIGMRPCSDQEAREDGAWDWREEGRLLIGQEDKEGRPGADDGCSWMVLIQWKVKWLVSAHMGDLEASRQMRIKKRLLFPNGGDGH